ncbi:Uncharacterised protein [uncultured archaeon]|nr:Uncharacterised protein [uncultured archaeon]
MVDLFIYDGSPVARDESLNSIQKDEMLQNIFCKVISSLKPSLPPELLLRTVLDRKGDNFGGIETFLTSCTNNGHDRTSDSDWGIMTDEMKRELPRRGYTGKDVIWARQGITDENPKPYNWYAAYGMNVGVLIIDKGAYKEEFDQIYGQKDVNTRKNGLLGILLFDMDKEQIEPRDNLHILLGDVKYAVDEIHQAGYFIKKRI